MKKVVMVLGLCADGYSEYFGTYDTDEQAVARVEMLVRKFKELDQGETNFVSWKLEYRVVED